MTSVDSNAVGVLGGVEYHMGVAILERQASRAVHNEPVLLSGGASADLLIRSFVYKSICASFRYAP